MNLDIERLPSGKFAINAVVLGVSMLAHNFPRWIDQSGLVGPRLAEVDQSKKKADQRGDAGTDV